LVVSTCELHSLYVYQVSHMPGSSSLFSAPTLHCSKIYTNTGRFIMFSVIMNIYNKKTKGLNLMELFTATRKTEKVIF